MENYITVHASKVWVVVVTETLNTKARAIMGHFGSGWGASTCSLPLNMLLHVGNLAANDRQC